MAKYKVLKKFIDINTKETYKEGQEIEMTEERAGQAIKNLKKWDGNFLERAEEDVKKEKPKGKGK